VRVLPLLTARFLLLTTGALALAGCGGGASSDMFSANTQDQWFSKKFDLFGKAAGGDYTSLKDAGGALRPVTAEDYVNADGSCAAAPAPVHASESGAGTPAGDLASAPASTPTGGGVALSMTECEVVNRLGRPEQVNIGAEGGDRAVTLTYVRGDRPGIYKFAGGRLKEIERGAEAPAPAKPVKKKTAKPKTAALPQR